MMRKFVLVALISTAAHAAVSLSTTVPVTQNFDAMGSSLTLPTDWKVDKPTTVRTVGTYSSALATAGLTGSTLGSSASNGIYNLNATSPTTDHAIGFLSSSGGTQSGNLYVQLVNNTGGALSGLQISYNVEKYRNGSNAAGFRIQLFYSTDGATWTTAPASPFGTAFGNDGTNVGPNPVPNPTTAVSGNLITGIPNGSNFFLAWNYSVTTGTTTTNAQGLAVDDISILGLTVPVGTGSANPSSTGVGFSSLLTVTATPGTQPASTGLAVTADLSSIGLSSTQTFFDDGTHGDVTVGDNIFSFNATIPAGVSGTKTIIGTISDAQLRSSTTSFSLQVGTPTNPSATGSTSGQVGSSVLLTAAVTAGAFPTSTGLAVTMDLSQIGGSSTQTFFDDGTHGDAVSGNNVFSFSATIDPSTPTGIVTLPGTVTDSQGRTGSASISLNVGAAPPTNPTGSGSANPSTVLAGASTTQLSVTVTPGTNPASTGIAVTADLTQIGGSATQSFSGSGNTFTFTATASASTAANTYTLPVTITDAQSRTGTASISLTVTAPVAAPSGVKISQVYGGGNNSTSTYKNDFIELFNQSTSPVNVTGWSVQQTSAAGTTWNVTPLCPSGTCTIQPGHYFLVQEAASTSNAGTTILPTPDVTGTINLGATSGKVLLVDSTIALSGACPTSVAIADTVGYDSSATCSETSPAPTPSNSTGVLRKGNGCTDTNNNANDFVELGPLPRNSSAPVNTCAVAGLLSGLGTASPSSVDPDGTTVLKVAVTPGTNSTGIAVTADLTALGGSASQQFFDDGTNGDVTSGDNTFSFSIKLPLLATGAYYISAHATDQQGGNVLVPITITVQSPPCGVERWTIKVGTDANANQVNTANPVRTTIQSMRALPTPASLPDTSRISPTENTTFVINGLMTVYKLETDSDYHIVLQDPQGNTMVTEIPAPACDGGTSPFDAAIKSARQKFDARLTGISTFQTANLPVQIKGVGFFDLIHGQTGVAPNGVEIHPILDIIFTAQSSTTLQSSLNPSQFNQNVTLTAAVTVPSGAATGNVTFTDTTTATVLGTSPLDGTGHASIQASGLATGSHVIVASYEGDSVSSESSGNLTQNVNPAAPVLTWNHPADILYGSALGSAQLNASSNVAGTFTYNPPAGTVPPVGNNQPLNATFTPTSTNYTSGNVGTTINVLPVQQPAGPSIGVTRVLSRDGSNNVVVQLTLTNSGGATANNVTVTSLKVGTATAPGLPIAVGNIAPSTSSVITVNMGVPIGASGAASTFSAGGAFTGGTFSSSARITLP